MTVPRRRPRRTLQLPEMLSQLAVASAETVLHRTGMAASGRYTQAEFQKMFVEKTIAMQQTALAAMMPGATAMALLTPWHRAATRNSRRLRRK